MTKNTSLFVALLGCLMVTDPAGGNESLEETLESRNAAILANTPDVEGVFEVQANGDILHLQSDMRCPGSFKNVSFWQGLIFSSVQKGDDVGCDYGRVGIQGYAESKLTIFATRTTDTLADAFARTRREIEAAYPEARYIGPALEIKSETNGSENCEATADDFRSAEYEYYSGGERYLSQVILAVRSGWIIKVRATFRTVVYVGESVDSTQQAINVGGDYVSPITGFLMALDSVKASEADHSDCQFGRP